MSAKGALDNVYETPTQPQGWYNTNLRVLATIDTKNRPPPGMEIEEKFCLTRVKVSKKSTCPL